MTKKSVSEKEELPRKPSAEDLAALKERTADFEKLDQLAKAAPAEIKFLAGFIRKYIVAP